MIIVIMIYVLVTTQTNSFVVKLSFKFCEKMFEL